MTEAQGLVIINILERLDFLLQSISLAVFLIAAAWIWRFLTLGKNQRGIWGAILLCFFLSSIAKADKIVEVTAGNGFGVQDPDIWLKFTAEVGGETREYWVRIGFVQNSIKKQWQYFDPTLGYVENDAVHIPWVKTAFDADSTAIANAVKVNFMTCFFAAYFDDQILNNPHAGLDAGYRWHLGQPNYVDSQWSCTIQGGCQAPGIDTDGDGICNDQDDDSDGDGTPDGSDPCQLDATDSCVTCNSNNPDSDQDGVCESEDGDDDADGTPDNLDPCPKDDADSCDCSINNPDSDGDVVCNDIDGDDDGDGIPDSADDDFDNDGVPNDVDDDDDGDGVPDSEETDSDSDGVPDNMDDDDDGDGTEDGDDECPFISNAPGEPCGPATGGPEPDCPPPPYDEVNHLEFPECDFDGDGCENYLDPYPLNPRLGCFSGGPCGAVFGDFFNWFNVELSNHGMDWSQIKPGDHEYQLHGVSLPIGGPGRPVFINARFAMDQQSWNNTAPDGTGYNPGNLILLVDTMRVSIRTMLKFFFYFVFFQSMMSVLRNW